MKSPFVQALVVAPVIYLLSAISVLFVMMNVIDPSTPGHRAGVSAVAFWAVLVLPKLKVCHETCARV